MSFTHTQFFYKFRTPVLLSFSRQRFWELHMSSITRLFLIVCVSVVAIPAWEPIHGTASTLVRLVWLFVVTGARG